MNINFTPNSAVTAWKLRPYMCQMKTERQRGVYLGISGGHRVYQGIRHHNRVH